MKLEQKVRLIPGTTTFNEFEEENEENIGIIEEIVQTNIKTKKGSSDHTRYNVRFPNHRIHSSQLYGFEDHQLKAVK